MLSLLLAGSTESGRVRRIVPARQYFQCVKERSVSRMPRKKVVRRFEPRYGVSEDMLAVEAQYVGREVEDYRVLSVAELKKMLAERQSQWLKADGTLQVPFEALTEQDRLIARCLLVRDIYHLLELYATYLRSGVPNASGVIPAEAEPLAEEEKAEERSVPFSEWLFRS